MVQQALSDADVSNDWTVTGAGSVFAALDDVIGSEDDATTMIETNTEGDFCEVILDNMTDPTVGTGHVLHWRANGSGSGAPERIEVTLIENVTERASSGNVAIVDSTWTDFSYTLSAAEADAITDYNNLRIGMNAVVLGVGETLQITSVYFEIPDVAVAISVLASPINMSAMI